MSTKFKAMNKLDRAYLIEKKWEFDYPVDFLCSTPEEFNKLKKQVTIIREAVKTGIER